MLDNFHFKKNLGQNFLTSSSEAKKITANWNINQANILEIGPGFGAITNNLILQAKFVQAVEIDEKLFQFLARKYSATENLQIIHKDIFHFPFSSLQSKCEKWIAVSNLPFSSCTKILKLFLSHQEHFSNLYFSFPEPIAKELLNLKNSSALQIICQLNFDLFFSAKIAADKFKPKPKIETIFIHFKNKQLKKNHFNSHFEKFIYQCFQFKRKKFLNNSKIVKLIPPTTLKMFLQNNDLPKEVRAEQLKLPHFISLFQIFNSSKN